MDEKDIHARAEETKRILVNREVASVSYMRHLCRQLRELWKRSVEKPEICVAVGAKGSGKTTFSRIFYQPFSRSDGSEFIKRAKQEGGSKDEYDAEFRVLMYSILSGRMLWVTLLKQEHRVRGEDVVIHEFTQDTLRHLVDQASRRSDAPVEVPHDASFKETIEGIRDQFRSASSVLDKMSLFPIFQGLPQEEVEAHAHRLLGNIETDAEALDLLNSQIPKERHFRNLPLLVFIDELGRGSAYGEVASMLYDCGSRAALFTGAGVVQQYIEQQMETSRLVYIPYRLSPILRPRDIEQLLRTAYELPAGAFERMSSARRKEAALFLLKSGGNPRLMIRAIAHYRDHRRWPADYNDLLRGMEPLSSPKISLATVSGLPILLNATVATPHGKRPLHELEVKNNCMLTPSFIPPLRSAGPSTALTYYHQIIAPVNSAAQDTLSRLYMKFAALCIDPEVPKRGLGLHFEDICVHTWQTRTNLRQEFIADESESISEKSS
eukprot:gnl/Chilomastix_cuspidata/1833.p1 GENE.gnl/Chilomastix_cuspidata/1833~~gnl/Chilomastix_cuspidata/1833.p1  ORF type:complete len:555 (+),score=145.43 gnl/Chilomastix_cuspidata/1833:184-1665(+)